MVPATASLVPHPHAWAFLSSTRITGVSSNIPLQKCFWISVSQFGCRGKNGRRHLSRSLNAVAKSELLQDSVPKEKGVLRNATRSKRLNPSPLEDPSSPRRIPNKLAKALRLVEKVPSKEWENNLEFQKLSTELNSKDMTCVLKELRDWGEALQFFAWMRNQPGYLPEVFHYNVLFKSLSRAREWNPIQWLMGEMQREGVKRDNVSFSTLISAASRCGQHESALSLFFEMQEEKGLTPDEVTYTAAIRALGKGGKADQALKIYEKMEKDGMRGDGVMYSTLIDLCGKAGKISEAERFFREMGERNVGKNEFVYNAMIDLYAKAGLREEASDILRGMEEEEKRGRGVKVGKITYSILMNLHVRHGEISEAVEIFKMMEKREEEERKTQEIAGSSPQIPIFMDSVAYNTLLFGLKRQKELSAAIALFRGMKEKNLSPSPVTLLIMAHVFSLLGDEKGVREIEREAVERGFLRVGGGSEGVEYPREGVKEREGEELVARSEGEQAFSLSPPLVDFPLVFYSSLLDGYGKAGRLDLLSSSFNQMLTRGIEVDAQVVVILLEALADCGMEDERVADLALLDRDDDVACGSGFADVALLLQCIETVNGDLHQLLTQQLRKVRGEEIGGEEEGEGEKSERARESSNLLNFLGAFLEAFPLSDRQGLCNALIDVFWNLDLKRMASEVFAAARTLRLYQNVFSRAKRSRTLNLRGLSLGACHVALRYWFLEMHRELEGGKALPLSLEIVTGRGEENSLLVPSAGEAEGGEREAGEGSEKERAGEGERANVVFVSGSLHVPSTEFFASSSPQGERGRERRSVRETVREQLREWRVEVEEERRGRGQRVGREKKRRGKSEIERKREGEVTGEVSAALSEADSSHSFSPSLSESLPQSSSRSSLSYSDSFFLSDASPFLLDFLSSPECLSELKMRDKRIGGAKGEGERPREVRHEAEGQVEQVVNKAVDLDEKDEVKKRVDQEFTLSQSSLSPSPLSPSPSSTVRSFTFDGVSVVLRGAEEGEKGEWVKVCSCGREWGVRKRKCVADKGKKIDGEEGGCGKNLPSVKTIKEAGLGQEREENE